LRVLSKKMKNLTSLTLSEAYFTYENHILIDHCFPLLKQLKITTHSNNYSRDIWSWWSSCWHLLNSTKLIYPVINSIDHRSIRRESITLPHLKERWRQQQPCVHIYQMSYGSRSSNSSTATTVLSSLSP
jgi:hypothetical protein